MHSTTNQPGFALSAGHLITTERGSASPAVTARATTVGSQSVSWPTALSDACIMIIDDEPRNIQLLRRILASAGVTRVHAVEDPREAVATFLEVRPDLVALDFHMPYLDGLAVLEHLSPLIGLDEFLPILMLTGDGTATVRKQFTLLSGPVPVEEAFVDLA